MKKTYVQPLMLVAELETVAMVCGSQSLKSDNGITFGGVDEEGTKDPESRRHRSVWDDDEEE